ncbi:hypothetical protein A2574_02640 [Candidatus Shapirobacteria bacterium RIFOXYD1_FULL_38_32]|uniref:Sporulation stage II protein D amidase enhancer LytB N-terminal domain-containing protein n=1 Tax=Candidatus Shapirobacteria bacterium RIFOXYB1_FULL_38_38 TaxID=1802151 RepID=A0A1F7SQL6_9BACT|nr:MAG: hypothetical protein A2367_03715 [Candidatus Shapirobacteria bacterium RIFOXYB1_FULL_38_38]OGL57659.1 MAG: hypothetical protein A2574_02640 [Candidatus Shapirobacteria bacterium RIFOXYD1_FULL_38_32]
MPFNSKKILLYIFILLSSFSFLTSIVHAKTIDEEIAEVTKQIADLEAAIAPLKSESSSLNSKITSAKAQITKTENQINNLGQRIIDREADLEVQHVLLGERVKRYYINTKKFNPLMIFLSSSGTSSLIREYSWYQAIINQDKTMIIDYNTEIKKLIDNKSSLEKETVKLTTLKKSLESRFGFLAGEIKKAEDYKKELSQKQKDLISAKTAMFNTSVGNVSSSDDPASRSDFNPGFSPAFAVFSFGAPHRKGMSQYGAYGRSKEGQNSETILKAYYGNIRIETVDMPGSINTTVGTLPFEDNYLLGIAEMPTSWGENGGMEALKAQAIAARTYALYSTGWHFNNRSSTGTICTTESCQVYSGSKAANPGLWRDAVNATKGQVIVSNSTNDIFSTMYASTSGGSVYSYSTAGHSTPMIWDTKCNSQSCWPNDSFEKVSGSPWYYKGWYKTRSGSSYGLSHPWLTNDQFSDIINAVLYFSRTNDQSHLSQTQNCIGTCDSNAWSPDELRRQVSDKGGPVSSVNSISVDYSTGGYTQSVRVSTDKGDFTFDGGDFKDIFTLRAPGALTAKSALYNIEKK